MNKTAKKGDTVTLADGKREKTFVVLGFTKTHANLAKACDYQHATQNGGEYCKMRYGYTSWNLKSSPIQKGFWELLKTEN
jgi:hypothetical protein